MKKILHDGINFIGEKFGKLTIIQKIEPTQNGKAKYLCKCDCGKEKQVYFVRLKNKNTLSCGCLISESKKKIRPNKSKGEGVNSFNSLYNAYKSGSKKRGLIFNIDKEKFRIITSSNCTYCGKSPSSSHKSNYFKYGFYVYNGIDRVDNEKGYIENNCVPCCKTCNYMKKELSLEDFKNHIFILYHNIFK